MEAATAIQLRRAPSVYDTAPSGQAADSGQTLAVSATYLLSEQGRKASLLAGGDGRAVQELKIQVPANRLHLVSVDANGVARLKLRPRFQLDGERGVTRIDVSPTYDAPPHLDDLFQEAARNHQLEEAFHVERRVERTKRRDVERERRAQIAQAFLNDRNQRALVHPAPTENRCYLSTEHGRLLIDTHSDEVLAPQVTVEAHRRFRADLRERKERNRQSRAAQLAVHDDKKRFVADWIAAHGTAEQRARHQAGVLPMAEVIEAIADQAFAAAIGQERYARDGAERLQAHLRVFPEYGDAVVSALDLRVTSAKAAKATAAQWAFKEKLQRVLGDANVVLREHKLASARYPGAPALTQFSILASCKVGPFTLRREFWCMR